jgi:hypothetical protein
VEAPAKIPLRRHRQKMNTHPESRKREGRVRLGDSVIALSNDLKTKLRETADKRRYPSEQSCLEYVLEQGFKVVEIEDEITNIIINSFAQTGTRLAQQLQGGAIQ